MPSITDGAFIFVLALLLFGPKKLPELARQLGKLMGEFRRASNEFRMQMEEELRLSEQAERQKKIAEMEASAKATPALDIPEPEHPHIDPALEPVAEHSIQDGYGNIGQVEDTSDASTYLAEQAAKPEAEPIASSGELNLMPPATGLPVARGSSSSIATAFESIPHAEPEPPAHAHAELAEHEQAEGASLHG